MTNTESIELTPSDAVADATQAVTLATSEAQSADAALAAAQAVLLAARQAFLVDPTPALEAEITAASAVVARCELYAEARTFGVRTAENLSEAAARLAAERELDAAGEAREALRRELRNKLDELSAHYDRASGVVAELESLVSRDQQICTAASDAQKRAKVAGSIRPIELDILLRAAQQRLAAGRPRPHGTKRDSTGMDRILAELTARTTATTADDKALILELALTAHARVAEGGGSVGIWMTPSFSPLPQFLTGTDSAARRAQGTRLLAALQGDHK